MPVVSEIGDSIALNDYEGTWATGVTYSSVHAIAPSSINVHAHLSRLQAIRSGPPGAAIGVSDFWHVSAGRTFLGPDSRNWLPLVYNAEPDKIFSYTISMEAIRGEVRGAAFAQFWG